MLCNVRDVESVNKIIQLGGILMRYGGRIEFHVVHPAVAHSSRSKLGCSPIAGGASIKLEPLTPIGHGFLQIQVTSVRGHRNDGCESGVRSRH